MKNKFPILFLLALLICNLFVIKGLAQTNNPRYFNERFIVNSMSKIAAAEMTFQAISSNGNFGSLSDLKRADLIDPLLASGSKYGYMLNLTLIPHQETTAAKFTLTATPQVYRKTGRRSFYIDENIDLRGAERNGDPANISDPLIDFCTAAGISNEVCAIQNLRMLYSAELTYQVTVGNGNFGNFSQLYRAGLVHQNNIIFIQNEYIFICEFTDYVPGSPATLKLNTKPANYGKSGIRSFYIDTDGIIHGADKNGGYANADDPVI